MWIPRGQGSPPFSAHAAPGDELPGRAKRIASPSARGSPRIFADPRGAIAFASSRWEAPECRTYAVAPGAAQAARTDVGGGAEAVKAGAAGGVRPREARYPMIPRTAGGGLGVAEASDLVGKRLRYDHVLREAAVPVVPRERRASHRFSFRRRRIRTYARAGEPRDSDRSRWRSASAPPVRLDGSHHLCRDDGERRGKIPSITWRSVRQIRRRAHEPDLPGPRRVGTFRRRAGRFRSERSAQDRRLMEGGTSRVEDLEPRLLDRLPDRPDVQRGDAEKFARFPGSTYRVKARS